MILGILLLSIFSKEEGVSVASIPCSKATGNYANAAYVTNNMIPKSRFTFSSNAPFINGKQLSNAFDDNNEYWGSNAANNDTFTNAIFINFETPVELEAILMNPAYHTDRTVTPNVRHMDGFPLLMKVYSSNGNKPFELQGIFTGKAIVDGNWDLTQYVFKRPFKCEKLKIEFTEVTLQIHWREPHAYTPAARYIRFIGACNHFNMPMVATQSNILENAIQSSVFTYISSPAMSDRPIDRLFDNDEKTYWVAENENTDEYKNFITVTFNSPTKLTAINFKALYSTSGTTRKFSGFPYVVNVYTSSSDQNVKLHTVFSGSPKDDWAYVQMAFRDPIFCKTLKLEFVEVSINDFAERKTRPGAHIITFTSVQVDEVEYEKSDYSIGNIRDKRVSNVHFTRSTDGGSYGKYVLSNMFDDNFDKSYWIPQHADDTFRPSVYIEFNEPVTIDCIYMYNAFSTLGPNSRRFDGAPTVLKVFTGKYNSDEYELNTIFTGNPGSDASWTSTNFPFKKPLYCEKLKIEFTEVTNNTLAGAPLKAPYIGQLAFVRSIAVPDEIIGIDPSGIYNTSSYIDDQKMQINNDRISATSSANGHDVTKAFDNDPSTYWKAGGTDASITIDLVSSVTLDAVIIHPSNSDFTGYPVLINVYGFTANGKQLIAKFARLSQLSADGNVYIFSSPVTLYKLTLEFVQVYPLSTKNGVPEIGEIILLKEPSQMIFPSQPGGDIIASPERCNIKYRCDHEIYEEVKTNLIIQGSAFNNYQSDTEGGAIRLINCGLTCTGSGTKFIDCTSREGGGAIFFKDEFSVGNTFNMEGTTFTRCQAVYGGALYIYTANDVVTISDCTFENTAAQQSPTGDSPFYGGSALFLTYNEGNLLSLTFRQISGNIVKFFNNFDVKPSSLKLLDRRPTILITHCTFNVKKNTKSSIHYVRGNSNALIKVSQCDFIGKLKEGAHHIDGEIFSKTSPKLLLTSCRFSSDSKSAFDLNPNNEYLLADLKDQVFNYKSFKNSNANYKVSTAFIVSACTVIAALITLIIFSKKNQAPTSQSENAEKSEEEAI